MCQSLTPPGGCINTAGFGEATLEGKVQSQQRLKKKKKHLSERLGDARIIREADFGVLSGCPGRGEVVPGGGARAYPLCPLCAGETEQLSGHPGRLQAGAEGARLRLLHGLRPG